VGRSFCSRRRRAPSFVVPIERPRCRVDADSLARHPGHDERNASSMRWHPPGMSRAWQDSLRQHPVVNSETVAALHLKFMWLIGLVGQRRAR
jgi:hypothetical protein